MENNKELISINILSYNRKDELRNTLSKVIEQDYKNIEVIVVDNASTDGAAEMIKQEFPSVHLIRLKKNVGIAGWNEGFKIAKGKYVLVLDDDSYPENGTILRGVKEFNENQNLAIVAFGVYNTKLKVHETKDFLNPPFFFNGCGAMFRKSIFDVTGYFNEMIFIYYHEFDFSAVVYDNGYDIMYIGDALIVHEQSKLSRGYKKIEGNPFKSAYRFYHYFISLSIILMQKFSLYYIVFFLPKWFLNRLIVCLFNKYYKEYFKAIVYLFRYSIKILSKRKVLKKNVQKFYRYGNEALIDRTYFPNFKKPQFLK